MKLLYVQENDFDIELLRSDKDDGSGVEQMDGVEEEITSGPFKTMVEWLVFGTYCYGNIDLECPILL